VEATRVRDRYVLQVLLATLGCGLLMAVIALVETPSDFWQRADNATAGASPRVEPVRSKAALIDATPPRVADFKDECDLPFHRQGGLSGRAGTAGLRSGECW